jgi:hypothetical protein
MTKGKRKPLHKITDGRLSASIWENQMQDGASFYGVTFSRFYKQGVTIRGSTSFGRNDLLRVAKLANEAYSWIAANAKKQAA